MNPTDTESLWRHITDRLSENDVFPTEPIAERSFDVLGRWHPSDALDSPPVQFWFQHACWRFPYLFPSFVTLEPLRSIQISEMWANISQEYAEDDEISLGTAGGWSDTYDRHFVALADLDGSTLVVDTRPGPAHGCISEYVGGPFDESNVRWGSLAELLAHTFDALNGATLFAGRYTATFVDGQIRWRY